MSVAEEINVNPAPAVTIDANKAHNIKNIEVEASFLGALLRQNLVYDRISEMMAPEYFYVPEHQKIYFYMRRLLDAGQEAKPTTMMHLVDKDDDLAGLCENGMSASEYLFELAANVVTVLNIKDYAKIIHDLYMKRESIGVYSDALGALFSSEDDRTATEQIESVEHKLSSLAATGILGDGPKASADLVDPVLEQIEAAFKSDGAFTGISTGFNSVDEWIGGLQRSQLYILAGRPGMGKTVKALNWSEAAARPSIDAALGADTGAVLFFSLEMSKDELTQRQLAARTGISVKAQKKGGVGGQEGFERLMQAGAEIKELNLYVDDRGALTVPAMLARAKRLKRQKGLKLIVIDYIQLIGSPKEEKKNGRVNEVSAITRGLKMMAKELDVPVVALSQLNRSLESREDKKPLLSDLRESGSIEQDADLVGFLYRAEYYLKKEEPLQRSNEKQDTYLDRHNTWSDRMTESKGRALFIIAKNRHGAEGEIELGFSGNDMKFFEFEHFDQTEDGRVEDHPNAPGQA